MRHDDEAFTSDLDWIDAGNDERLLLGLCLRDADAAAEVVALVPPEDLERPEHRALLRLIATRVASGQGTDVVSLVRDIQLEGNAKLMGGYSYIAELPEYCPSTRVDLVALADRIRVRAVALGLREVATALDHASYGRSAQLGARVLQPRRPIEAAAAAAEHLSQLGRARRRTEWQIGEALDEAVAQREAARRDEKARPVGTGFGELNAALNGGLRPGQLVIVAGRPGSGKSALALGIALEAAGRGRRVGYVSLEMEASELADRALSRVSLAPLTMIVEGELDSDAELNGWREVVSEMPLRVAAPPSISAVELAAQARRWSSRGLDMLIVDYLQLIRHQKAERQDLAVGATATLCKELARALKIPVVLLSQLNREVEKRGTKPKKSDAAGHWWERVSLPRASDLRESGQIEQDADIILFPVRAAQFGLGDDRAAIVVEKNRNGRTGTVPAQWHGTTASYWPADVRVGE